VYALFLHVLLLFVKLKLKDKMRTVNIMNGARGGAVG
jgi:hypothetical protein